MPSDGLDPEIKRKICGVLKLLFPHARVYLYGSRARGTFHDRSDIDLAIDNGKAPEPLRLGEARDMLEGIRSPYKIDLFDFNYLPETMQETIKREGIQWIP